MEGRKPPPKASHPFPDYPDISKFWGTPYPKAVFKTFGSFCLIWGTALAINMYVTREQKGMFGQDWTMTKEQAEKRQKMRELTTQLQLHYDLQVEYAHEKARMTSNYSDMLFDDGVKFSPPKELVTKEFVYTPPKD